MKLNLIFTIFLIFLTSICDTISQLLLKSAINSLDSNIDRLKKIFNFIIKIIRIPWVWLGLIFSGVSLIIWLFVLSKTDLNLAFSLDSMHYILIALTSGLVLKEKVGFSRWLGTILIVAGIFLVTLSGN